MCEQEASDSNDSGKENKEKKDEGDKEKVKKQTPRNRNNACFSHYTVKTEMIPKKL